LNRSDSNVSAGVRWAHRITTVGLEFALPPLGGAYLDRRWGMGSLLTIVGAILGFLMGMTHLLLIARETAKALPAQGRGLKRDDTDTTRKTTDKSHESGWSDHG